MEQVATWGWCPICQEWEKVPLSCLTIRRVAVGQVYLGHCRLHWVIMNPSAPNALLAVTDANAALAAIVLDFFEADRNTLPFTMAPPKWFETGIYLETFTNLTSVIFGYTPA